MMTWAIARCFATEAVTAILVDPLADNLRAISFYEKLGFIRIGKQQYGADNCFVYRIDRKSWMTEN